MEFSKVSNVFAKKSGIFLLRGWVKRKREGKENAFVLFRDSSGEIQCVFDKAKLSKKELEDFSKTQIEASVFIEGEAHEDERSPNGVELKVTKFTVIDFGQEFPIQKDLSEDFLLDVRHLWLRSTKMTNALKAKSILFKAFRDFMQKEGYNEVHCPSFVSGAVEGGSTLFEVPYFGKKVYLTQSSQFYLEAFITSLEKVYTIAPSFRAEPSRTRRHVTEFQHAEWETAWEGLPELLDFHERMLKFVCNEMVNNASDLMKYFGRDPRVIETVVNSKFERFKYDEVFTIAQKKFPELKWGDDLGEKEEREITKDYSVPIMVTHYPATLKPFYHRPDPTNPKVVLCCDVLAPEGYGEIVGSGERCKSMDELIARMKAENLKPEAYGWYMDLRKYGSVPHSGAGLGLERLLTWIMGMEHIRDVIAFPRTMNRFYP
ncbi:MAG: asparagine--tRNA ligase [Candidatus Diapherotrites archaeon]|nr:asparagine--tRNA ligase [Candidatus Diapherotrites archaeon]